MPFQLPELPYAKDALEPHYSAKTLEFHHGKHHNAYITKTNELVAGTELDGKPVEEVIAAAKAKGDKTLFNQSAQIWNHTFFWHGMAPGGGGAPKGAVAEAIDKAFGSYADFVSQFKAKAAGNFGSGWTWLVKTGGGLEIVNTDDADTPLAHDGMTPLLTVDVWEHAYYLDYQNRRPDYVQSFFDNLVNWDFVNENFAKA
ncbi:superoxide dismutase [Algihabitans albus]|uniref:superoxide dismutase n=1 Tax=Algihabitans albus TaxID=2164067 RepID=UPI000E5D1D46|nr:superoxide dismutase [Algihabitans albus]